jgi:hypothetical protein
VLVKLGRIGDNYYNVSIIFPIEIKGDPYKIIINHVIFGNVTPSPSIPKKKLIVINL